MTLALSDPVNLSAAAKGRRLTTEGWFEICYNELEEAKPVGFKLFKQKNTMKREEYMAQYLGLTMAEETPIGADTPFEDPMDGGTKRVRILRFAKGFRVAVEDEEDDLYDVLGQIGKDLPLTFVRRTEALMAGTWAGMDTTVTGFDGLTIANTAHPYESGYFDQVDPSNATQSNYLNGGSALTPSSLLSAQNLMQNVKTKEGMPGGFTGSLLVVHPNNRANAFEILASTYESGSTTNTRNVFATDGGLWPMQVLSWEWLPNDTDWWLVDPMKSPGMFFWRNKPEFHSQTALNAFHKEFFGRMRCAADMAEWRGVVMATA